MNQDMEMPQFLVSKRPDENLAIFNARVKVDDTIREFFRDVIGIVIEKTDNGNIVFKPGKNAIMTLDGAVRIHTIIRGHVNTVTSLTRWTEDQVALILERTCEDIAMFLWGENQKMELDDEILLAFAGELRTFIHGQLNKAINGFENNQISKLQRIDEIKDNREKERSWRLFSNKQPEAPQ